MRLHRAVNDAEAICGLQFCVVFTSGDDVAESARAAIESRGIPGLPAVLVAADEASSAIEVTLGRGTDGRITAADVDAAMEATAAVVGFRNRIAEIVHALATTAGPGVADQHTAEIPDVIE